MCKRQLVKKMPRKHRNCSEPYNIHEIQKKILKKDDRKRLDFECLGYKNKHRDENYKIYEDKKRQFIEAGKKYQEMNKLALLTNKVKLEGDYETLDFGFLEEIPEENIFDEKYTHKGRLLRKRTERSLNRMPIMDDGLVCVTGPWFRRYLILNKFIQVARGIIYYGRLLKNLMKLRLLNEENVLEYESKRKECNNVSYAEIFDKFL